MRRWMTLAWMALLLTGLIAAPALAFCVRCDGMANAMTMSMPMAHDHHRTPASAGHSAGADMTHPAKDYQNHTCPCAVHCLGAGAVFLAALLPAEPIGTMATMTMPMPQSVMAGLQPGPPFEPPISVSV